MALKQPCRPSRRIRTRIASVKNTQKITRAMKLVAAARLRRAQDAMVAARPYARRLEEVISDISARSEAATKGSPIRSCTSVRVEARAHHRGRPRIAASPAATTRTSTARSSAFSSTRSRRSRTSRSSSWAGRRASTGSAAAAWSQPTTPAPPPRRRHARPCARARVLPGLRCFYRSSIHVSRICGCQGAGRQPRRRGVRCLQRVQERHLAGPDHHAAAADPRRLGPERPTPGRRASTSSTSRPRKRCSRSRCRSTSRCPVLPHAARGRRLGVRRAHVRDGQRHQERQGHDLLRSPSSSTARAKRRSPRSSWRSSAAPKR